MVLPGWTSTCYVTIYNTETGQSMRAYGVGAGGTQSEALANCGANERKVAMSMVDALGQ